MTPIELEEEGKRSQGPMNEHHSGGRSCDKAAGAEEEGSTAPLPERVPLMRLTYNLLSCDFLVLALLFEVMKLAIFQTITLKSFFFLIVHLVVLYGGLRSSLKNPCKDLSSAHGSSVIWFRSWDFPCLGFRRINMRFVNCCLLLIKEPLHRISFCLPILLKFPKFDVFYS